MSTIVTVLAAICPLLSSNQEKTPKFKEPATAEANVLLEQQQECQPSEGEQVQAKESESLQSVFEGLKIESKETTTSRNFCWQ